MFEQRSSTYGDEAAHRPPWWSSEDASQAQARLHRARCWTRAVGASLPLPPPESLHPIRVPIMSGRQQRVMVQPIVRLYLAHKRVGPFTHAPQNVIFKNLQQVCATSSMIGSATDEGRVSRNKKLSYGCMITLRCGSRGGLLYVPFPPSSPSLFVEAPVNAQAPP
jgi:hypothetical protein